MSFVLPEWPIPGNIVAGFTTSEGGCSKSPYASNNLALHVGDQAEDVLANRAELDKSLPGKKQWAWLNQVHSNIVVSALLDYVPEADAVYSCEAGQVCAVLTADCLPLLVTDVKGSFVAAIHAGWKGLANGIIKKTLERLNIQGSDILVYLGPAISVNHYEVGQDMKDVFDQMASGQYAEHFLPGKQPGKYFCDLNAIARSQLESLGITRIFGGGCCTYSDDRFYSYRQTPVCGRIASFIYIQD